MTTIRSLALSVALVLAPVAAATLAPSVAEAGANDPKELTVKVLDAETGAPIPTAVVRHPDEADRHQVNAQTGEWTASVLYMPDGRELAFTKGTELVFEVSAPGYMNQKFVYVVKGRKKQALKIPMQKMDMDSLLGGGEDEDPVIQFGRDKPIN